MAVRQCVQRNISRQSINTALGGVARKDRPISLPDFERDGFLPDGIFSSSGAEFVDRFCSGDDKRPFAKAITDILDFATERGGTRVIFGGSFISSKSKPGDVDCAIVFEDENQIPARVDRLKIDGVRIDIFFCSEDQPNLLGGITALFRKNRSGRQVGIVEVIVADDGQALWEIVQYPDDTSFEIIQRAYINRHVEDVPPSSRALITVHGIRSRGDWSAEVCHIASGNGWIVAPFTYGYQGPNVFWSRKKRDQIVDEFRAHIFDIHNTYDADISVLAHSFGTYITARYLFGFDEVPVGLDTLIMTGSVLDRRLPLTKFDGRAASVVHEVAPNDEWVRFAPAFTWSDKLFGSSGQHGFDEQNPAVEHRACDVFNHNNVIRRDVVISRWMPRLEANVGRWRREGLDKLLKRKS